MANILCLEESRGSAYYCGGLAWLEGMPKTTEILLSTFSYNTFLHYLKKKINQPTNSNNKKLLLNNFPENSAAHFIAHHCLQLGEEQARPIYSI